MKHRLAALDWMRGVVMVLMATDHASGAYNKGRLMADSFFMYQPGSPLPAMQFLHRWISHLCAPTFLFLAGTALALSVARRSASPSSSAKIDRDLFLRGTIILLLDPLFVSYFWVPGKFLLQVLYAIGLSLILMIPLRRLSTRALGAGALGLLIFGELIVGLTLKLGGGMTLAGGLVATGGFFPRVVVGYPLLPWLAIMMLGWTFGRVLISSGKQGAERILFFWGTAGITCFLVLRGLNAYGNMMLPREDSSLVQWLHVSKYPPSLTFVGLELGLMALILAGLFRIERGLSAPPRSSNPLLVFGQTALFFYLAHILILEFSARSLGVYQLGGLAAAWAGLIPTLVLLYPLCLIYRRFKSAHPTSWMRFI